MNNQGQVRITMELEVSAQRILNQFMLHNKQMEEQLEAGIKKAVESFDFERAIEQKVKSTIQNSFLTSTTYSRIQEIIDEKINNFIDANIDMIIDNLKTKIDKS